MFKSIRDKWLSGLRSGKFRQGKFALKRNHGEGDFSYCCLGVLAEQLDPNGFKTCGITNVYQFDNFSVGSLQSSRMESVGVRENWVDLQQDLVKMNDTGASFAQIADWIEMNIPETAEGS